MAEALLIGAIGGALYTRLTSYDDLAEIKSNTLAAGFPSAGILLAVGVVMEAAVAGRASSSCVSAEELAVASLSSARRLAPRGGRASGHRGTALRRLSG